MLAVIARGAGGPEVLDIVERLLPTPLSGQVRVRVVASSVNPIDLSARAGRLVDAGLMAPMDEVPLGWDVAGTISAVGELVEGFAIGEEVLGLRDLLFAGGAHAEEVTLDATAIARAPSHVSLQLGASLPLNGLTAARALDLTGLRAGASLLVTGAAGGVGGYTLELARLRGLRTVALADVRDEELVRSLGATDVVPRTAHLGTAVRAVVPGGVDAVIDAAVLGIQAHEALRSEGTFVALVAPFAPPPIRATRVSVQEVWADGARLAELVALVDAGRLTPRVASTHPLTDAALAHAEVEQGGTRGRVLLLP